MKMRATYGRKMRGRRNRVVMRANLRLRASREEGRVRVEVGGRVAVIGGAGAWFGGGELAKERSTVGSPDVEGDPALVGIHGHEEEAVLGVRLVAEEGRNEARAVTARALDLDDVRAHIGQQLAAVDARLVRDLENPQAFEGPACRGAHSVPRPGQPRKSGRV